MRHMNGRKFKEFENLISRKPIKKKNICKHFQSQSNKPKWRGGGCCIRCSEDKSVRKISGWILFIIFVVFSMDKKEII